ncbi:hypothetical protein B484DRAFT_390908, partial [Ochromonadaceae sp. CCMP2298]
VSRGTHPGSVQCSLSLCRTHSLTRCWALRATALSLASTAEKGLSVPTPARYTLPGQEQGQEQERAGLFSVPGLLSPEDFAHLAARAERRIDLLRALLGAHTQAHTQPPQYPYSDPDTPSPLPPPPSLSPLPPSPIPLSPATTLALLDSISSELCGVIDAAELCRNVHADHRFRSAAEGAFGQLSNVMILLNADAPLHAHLVRLLEGRGLDEEQHIFALDLR